MAQLVNLLPIALGILLFFIIIVWPASKVVKQWERGIVLRFGRYTSIRSPGLNVIIPYVERMIKVDTRWRPWSLNHKRLLPWIT
jgi:regulator of protease activity HflC (stomatin/prohibitin superfamily)